jgi:hypothetical protein
MILSLTLAKIPADLGVRALVAVDKNPRTYHKYTSGNAADILTCLIQISIHEVLMTAMPDDFTMTVRVVSLLSPS